jgi:hypothetical protein
MMTRRHVVAVVAVIGCSLSAAAQIGGLVQVSPSGQITPTNAVATIADVAQAVATAAAAAAEASVAASTASAVSNMLSDVNVIINGLEGVGYIRGYTIDFGVSGSEPNTNVTATIVDFVPNVSNDVTYTYSDVYTFFTESPAEFPVCRWSASAGRTNEWDVAESVAVDLVERLVGSTLYECYRNTVRVPVVSSTAFFRVFAEAVQSQVGAVLPVQNGVSPSGREPLTLSVTAGTNTISFVGGIRVVPD